MRASLMVLVIVAGACSGGNSTDTLDVAASEVTRSAWLDEETSVTTIGLDAIRTTDMSVMRPLTPAEETAARIEAAASARAEADAAQAARDQRLEELIAAAPATTTSTTEARVLNPRPNIPTTTTPTTAAPTTAAPTTTGSTTVVPATTTIATTSTTDAPLAVQSVTIPDLDADDADDTPDADDADDADDTRAAVDSSTTTTTTSTTVAPVAAFSAPERALGWIGQRFDLVEISSVERDDDGGFILDVSGHTVLDDTFLDADDDAVISEPVFTGPNDGRWEFGTGTTSQLRVDRSAEVRVLYDAGRDRACSRRDVDPDFEQLQGSDLLWLVRVGRADEIRDSLASLTALTFNDDGIVTRLSLSRIC